MFPEEYVIPAEDMREKHCFLAQFDNLSCYVWGTYALAI